MAGAIVSLATATLAAEDRLGAPLPEGAVQRLGTLSLRYTSGIGDLCYLPDGRGVIGVGASVEIWDLAAGKLQATHGVCDASLSSVVPRSDGQALLVGDSSGKVHEWELAGARVLRSWSTGQAGLKAAHYSPDGERVLTTGSKPPTIKEWELETGRELVSITGKMHYFHEAIYGPEGRTAFVNGGAGSNEVLAHYDLATGGLLREELKDYYTHTRSIVLSADRERVLLGSRHKATEWLIDGYKLLKQFTGHHGHAVTSVAYCADSDQLLTGSRDGSVRRWDRHKPEVLLRWWPHDGHVTHMDVSPDGKWLLSYGRGLVAETSMATGEFRLAWERHSGPVQATAVTPSGETVVSGSTDGTLRMWNALSGECLGTMEGATLGAYAVAVSPDGSRVAAGCKDGIVREFSLPAGDPIRELAGHRGYVRSVVYADDGTRLLSSAGDGTIRVWAAEQEEPVSILEGHRGGVLSIALSPDGRLVLSGGRDGTVRLWDLNKGTPQGTFEGHRAWVTAVTFAGDDEHALSGSRDGRVLQWDLRRGEVEAEMIHGGEVHALACTPDGRTACASGTDELITCWDLTTGEKIAALTGHESDILGLAITPDGKHLISASHDTTLLVWRMPR
jgi:WD40 repeat protein